jgi:hypothetical protein
VPPHHPAVSRRTALGAALGGVVALSGCDLELADLDPRSEPTPAGAPTASAPPADADTTLVADVVAEIGAALALADAVRRPYRKAYRPLARLHRAHLDLLDGEPPEPGAPTTAAAARAREEQLQVSLAEAAGRAGSGELARVLASMSAAVAQQLATLPAGGAS